MVSARGRESYVSDGPEVGHFRHTSHAESEMGKRLTDSPELDRQLLKLTVSKKNAVVAACDDHLRYVKVLNPHPAFREADLISKRDDEIVPREHVAELVELKEEVLEEGEPLTRRISIVVGDHERIYDVTAEPIMDQDGTTLGVATAALDVTREVREAEFFGEISDRLAPQMTAITEHWHRDLRSRTRLRPRNVFPGDDLLDGIPKVVGQLVHGLRNGRDPSRDNVEALRAVADYWKDAGYSVEEALLHFRMLGDIVHDALKEAIDDLGADVPPSYGAAASERICRGLNLIQVVLVGRYRDAEEERFLDFGSNVVHEIRTHVGAAQTSLQFIQLLDEEDGGGDERREELLSTARSSLELSAQLIESIRELSQADPVEGDHWERGDLGSIVRYVSEGVEEARADGETEIEVVDGIPSVSVPEGPVSLILHNLLENAVKYADPGKPKRWVRLHFIRDDEDDLLVRIGDNGLGIPESEQERIFERFCRGQQTSGDGFGLGLSIARQAAHRIGSRLMLESEPGEGSTFSFTIPAECIE